MKNPKRFFKKEFISILLVLFFSTLTSNAQTLIFSQDFNAGADAIPVNVWSGITNATFVSATPSSNQFTSIIGGRHSTSYLDINTTTTGEVYMNSGGSGMYWAFTRSVGMSATPPGAVMVQMRVKIDVTSTNTSPKFFLAVGSGMLNDPSTAAALKPASATVHSGVGIRYASISAGSRVWDYGAGAALSTSDIADNTYVLLTFVANNSGAAVSYSPPGGGTESLANDTWDLWVDNTKFCNDQAATTPGLGSINQFKFGDFNGNGRASWNIDYVNVYSIGSTTPTVSASPVITGLNFNTSGTVDNVGGNPGSNTFVLTGANLNATAARVTPPANFQISLTGTGGWVDNSSYIDVLPTSGSINQTIYVRINPAYTTLGPVSGAVSFTHAQVAAIPSLNVSGDVVNLTPLACPATMAIDGPSISSSSADFTWTNVADNQGYIVRIYKAGVKVGSDHPVAINTTTYNITGLDPLTAYTARVTVVGNGSSSGNSIECAAQAFTTLAAPPSGKMVCWTEDFETLAPSENTNSSACPASGATTNELRFNAGVGTYRCDGTSGYDIILPSGLWTNGASLGANGQGRGGSSRSLYLHQDEAQISLPALDNPKTITFYLYQSNSIAANNIDRGLRILVDGVPKTTGIYVDDVEMTTSTTVVPSFNASGMLRLGANATWTKISFDISSTSLNTVTIDPVGSNSGAQFSIDDVTVECSSMLLEAAPNVAGLYYVVDLGPSAIRTFTVTGTDLPVANGNITLSNLGDFQLSLDNGITWSAGASVTLPYTGNTFAKSVMVRLKAGLGINSYATTVAFACPGYTKVLPSISFSGKVTLLPNTLPCGDEVTLLNLKGTNEATILLDAVTGTNWTGTSQAKNNHLLVDKSTSISSPTISLGEYDLKEVSFYYQPTNANATNVVMSAFGDGGSFSPVAFPATQKLPYSFTQDLSAAGFTGNFHLTFTAGSATDVEMWGVVLTAVPKRLINLSTPTLSGFSSSSLTCPSEEQSLMIIGTCLDDNSSLDFTSTLYEFSKDGVTWAVPNAQNIAKLTYAGSYPLAGMKVYVRQKGTSALVGFTASESVTITNGGKGSSTLLLSGTVTPPADIQVPAAANFASLSGVESIQSIPIIGGVSCDPLVVTHNCGGGLTLSNCDGGTYAASATFAVDDLNRTVYLKYTPGTNLNCTLTLTAGTYTKTIPITWTGTAAIVNGVATDNMAVKYLGTTGYGSTNVWKAGALPDATIVTITSADFDVSLGNPAYGDFVALTSAKLGDMKGTLYIRQKAAALSGSITLATAGGQTTTINVTVQ